MGETGIITTVVGTGQWGFNGDGPGLEVNLTYPAAIVFDSQDCLYIADTQATVFENMIARQA